MAIGMPNLYSFIQGSLKSSFSALFFSDVLLWNQYKQAMFVFSRAEF